MTVQLVASCTERKRATVPEELRLRSVVTGENRSAKWLAELERNPATPKPARQLYGGEHWQLVLELERQLRDAGREVRLWVASAGYGLVSADTQLKPYSATFVSSEPDGVPAAEASSWWDTLCAGSREKKTLQSLAGEADTLVVIASAKYLRAMLPDLSRARHLQQDSERLIVFSGSDVPQLAQSLVRVSDRAQSGLGGTKLGLAARTARHLLTEAQDWPPTAKAMKAAYAQLVFGEPRPEVPNRSRHLDDAVRVFINKQLDEEPSVGWTKLLRRWRDSGQACEQKRFRGLYQDVKSKRG